MTVTEAVARDVILALLDARDFLAYQLSHANGDMSDAQLDKIAERYLRPTHYTPTLLRARVRRLQTLIGNRVDMDVISTVFCCSLEEARTALAPTRKKPR